MLFMRRTLPLLLLLTAMCATANAANVQQVNGVIDDFHKAAAAADEPRYFALMAPDFVFLGTDATERWDLAAFRTFVHPYFSKGTGWTFTPHDRHLTVSPSGNAAWFDEKLDSASYGDCRGSGALEKVAGEWKMAQYNLTIPIPNALAKTVVKMIREAK
jgi:ketosteroid isomerase-like protein